MNQLNALKSQRDQPRIVGGKSDQGKSNLNQRINELLEFIATVLVPETGVGGYVNTSLDLVSDLIGAILAMVIIRLKK